MSVGYVVLSVKTSQFYVYEVNQKLNKDVAAHILDENALLDGENVNLEEIQTLFHNTMVINPSLEVYLVNPNGKIIAYDAPRGTVKRARIALQPIDAFLSGAAKFPILGDDPRSLDGRKAFTVYPVMPNGVLQGYLYVVLGGEVFDTMASIIGESYILTIGLTIAAICLLISFIAGLAIFNFLTRRLRRLNAGVENFRKSDFQNPMQLTWRQSGRGDEIDQLGYSVEQMSERIVQQIRQLRDADDMRKEMLINISHDLRTPLTALNGFLETLHMRQDNVGREERQSFLDQATKQVKSISMLVEQVFELTTLESGGLKPVPETFSFSELMHDVVQKFTHLLDQNDLSVHLSIPPQTPNVMGDIALIERVLDNLIENAIKYTPSGGEVRLTLRIADKRVQAEISDNGSGISAEELPFIFERFYRSSDNSGPAAIQGSGLGLAIAKRILQLHETTIDVHSRPNAGASFKFGLPVAA